MTDATDGPSDRLTIQYKGEEKILFMSFQRLNSILRVLGNPQNIVTMMVDPDISEAVVRVLVAPKASAGSMFEVEIDDEDILTDDFDRMMNWARDHVASFFVKRLQGEEAFQKALAPMMAVLKLSLAGSAG